MNIPPDTTFMSVKIGSGDTRLFTLKAGLSFLRLLSAGHRHNVSTAYSDRNPTYQIEFFRKEDLEHQEINRLLGLESHTT